MELKPCPFCGANAELQTNMFAGDSCCWIECLRCGTEGPLSDTVKLPEAQDQAIAKWNRRAQLAAPAAPDWSSAFPESGCNFPLCKSEAEQGKIADQVYRELYSGEPAQLAASDLRATFRDTMDSLDMAELAVQQEQRIAELEKQLAAPAAQAQEPQGWIIEDHSMLRYTSDERSARGYAKIGRLVWLITATKLADFDAAPQGATQ